MSNYDFVIVENLDKIQCNGALSLQPALSPAVVTPASAGTQTSLHLSSGYRLEILIVGTSTFDVYLEGYQNEGGPYDVSIDGADNQQVTASDTSGFAFQLVASALSAGKHLLRVDIMHNFYLRGIRAVSSGAVTLGTVPRPFYCLKDNMANTTAGFPGNSGTSAIQKYGGITFSGDEINIGNYAGHTYEFDFVGTGFSLLTQAGAGGSEKLVAVSVDGGAWVLVDNTSTSDFNGARSMICFAAGLSRGSHTAKAMFMTGSVDGGAMPHFGTILSASCTAGATSIFVGSVVDLSVNDWISIDQIERVEVRQIALINSGTGEVVLTEALAQDHSAHVAERPVPVVSYSAEAGSISYPAHPSTFSKRIVGVGDSITHAASYLKTGFAGYDPRASWVYRAALALGYEFIDLAIQGRYSAQMPGDSDLETLGPNGDIYAVLMGTNDLGGAATSIPDYITNMVAGIERIKAVAKPGALILLTHIFSTVGLTNVISGLTKVDYNNALDNDILSAVEGDGFDIRVIDITQDMDITTIGSGNVDIPDTTHPANEDTVGQGRMGINLIALLSTPTTSLPVLGGGHGLSLSLGISL